MNKALRDKKAILFFILPAALLFTLVLFGPILYAGYISLCDWNALTKPKFIGFGNKDSIGSTASAARVP